MQQKEEGCLETAWLYEQEPFVGCRQIHVLIASKHIPLLYDCVLQANSSPDSGTCFEVQHSKVLHQRKFMQDVSKRSRSYCISRMIQSHTCVLHNTPVHAEPHLWHGITAHLQVDTEL